MQKQLLHPASPGGGGISSDAYYKKRGKSRGSYNCGRCGQPKKGHSCNLPPDTVFTPTTADSTSSASVTVDPLPLSVSRPVARLRRALSFDDFDVRESMMEIESDVDVDEVDNFISPEIVDLCYPGNAKLPASCLWEVMRRLPPISLLSAAKVCKGWRDTTRKLWKAAEELKLRVPVKAQARFARSVLQKCPAVLRLSLRMESDVDATMLACIAFSCPNLESLEMFTSETSVNRITGDELGRFVADKRCLTSLKMEGCSTVGGFVLSSSSLSTLWLSGLQSVSKMVFNCPSLKELSLVFSHQEKDNTDLTAMMDSLGRNCFRLQNIHISSSKLSHSVVLSLTAANLRYLRMLSLVLGQEITDASVAAITSTYTDLELLDLSGSSISDSGIGMICNVLPDTLSKLLLALCPNITSSGIQFATAQLPLLELMDCGMTICDSDEENSTCEDNNDSESQFTSSQNSKLHLMYQKLIIKHCRLKKLSLWGCSGLDALYLNCPELVDLNLNSCKNLNPERLVLQCPNLDNVHASGCQEILVKTIENQIKTDFGGVENQFAFKRLADGSKRVRVPHFLNQQDAYDDEKKDRRSKKRKQCNLILD